MHEILTTIIITTSITKPKRKTCSMPQATLLNFFKSQTPGPFAPVTLPPEAPPPHVEVKKEGDLRRRASLSEERQSTNERATKPASQQTPRNDETITDFNILSPELRLPGLTIVTVQIEHLPALKRLTGTLLPVRYPDKFFDEAVNEGKGSRSLRFEEVQ